MPILNFLKNAAQDVINPIERDVVAPAVSNVENLGKGVEKAPLLNFLRTGAAYATGNQQAEQSSLARTKTDLNQTVQNLPAQLKAAGAEGDPSEGNLLNDDTATKLAATEDPTQVSKVLEPTTGKPLADKISSAVAQTKDPNIVQNIVKNGIKGVLPAPEAPAPPVEAPTPSPTPQGTGKPFFEQANELGTKKGMADILSEGGSTDEAANHYMQMTGSDIGTGRQAVADLIKENPDMLNKSMVNAKLNPLLGKFDLPDVSEGDSDQAILNRKLDIGRVYRAGDTMVGALRDLSPNDLKLVDNLPGNDPESIISQAEEPDKFRTASDAITNFNNTTHAIGSARGQELPLLQNHGITPLYDPSPENQAAMEAAKADIKSRPGYTEGRIFKNGYTDAAQYGVKPLFENAIQDALFDINRRASDIGQLTLKQGLDQAFPGKIKVGDIGVDQGGVYKQLNIPGGQRYSAPADIAEELNKRAPAPEATGAYEYYKNLNAAAKDIKLVSGFHSITSLDTWVGQQLSSGNLFTHPGDTLEAIKATLSDKAFSKDMDNWSQVGTSDPNHSFLEAADVTGLNYKNPQADVGAEGILGKIPVLKQLHDSIFGREIPYEKLKSLEQRIGNLDIWNNSDDMKAARKISLELNQNFGGMARDLAGQGGLTPSAFNKAANFLLSTDFTEGQLRTVKDAFTKGGPDGALARQTVLGKALLVGGIAAAGGALGGEYKGMDAKQTALAILNKAIDPSFKVGGYNVGLPSTQLSLLGKPIEKSIAGAQPGNPLAGLKTQGQDFATARLASLPSDVLQGVTNKNFYGQPIYGQDTHGRPISPGQTAANIAGVASPIALSQGVQTATGNESVEAGIANAAGLNVTPTNQISNLPIEQQTYISTLQKALSSAPPAQSKPVIDAITNFDSVIKQNYAERTKVDTQINKDIASGNMSKAQADANAFNQKLYQAISKAITPATQQYLSIQIPGTTLKTPYQYLTGNTYGYFTNLDLSSRKTTIKDNPTKYGLKIGAVIP